MGKLPAHPQAKGRRRRRITLELTRGEDELIGELLEGGLHGATRTEVGQVLLDRGAIETLKLLRAAGELGWGRDQETCRREARRSP